MMLIKDKDIEYILSVLDNGYRTFGEANVALAKHSPLKQLSAERHLTCFQLKNNPAYSVTVEAQGSSLDHDSGPVRFAIHYHHKHSLNKSTASRISDPQSLGDLLSKAGENHIDFNYLSGVFERAGLKWTGGYNRNRTYTGEAVMEGVQVGVHIDLHELPDCPRFPRVYSLELHVKVSPQFKYAPVPSPQPVRHVSSPQLTLPLRFAAIKP